jgi:hypothetical protein
VTVHHQDGVATVIEPEFLRYPWSTCPGATARLKETFTGVRLEAFAERGEKGTNCTHLHDLAVLAAAHAVDDAPLIYDTYMPDNAERRYQSELRRNGETVLSWVHQNMKFLEPAELAGTSLMDMRKWLSGQDPQRQEYARILRLVSFIGQGRATPEVWDLPATSFQGQACFTFQAHIVKDAHYVGVRYDFSISGKQILAPH